MRAIRIIIGAVIGTAAAVVDATLVSTSPPNGAAEFIGFCVPWALAGAAIGYFVGRRKSKTAN
jgi:Na+/phosphate symporter